MTATAHHIVPPDFRRYRVSRSAPCPVCGRPDWCLSDGSTWALCQRVEKGECWGDAGWFHRLDDRGRDNGHVVVPSTPRAPATAARISGWKPRGNPESVHYYNSAGGDPLYRKIKYRLASGGKITPFERYGADRDHWVGGPGCMNGVQRVLYRNECIDRFEQIIVVEGEKSSDLLWDFGLCATCADSGAGKWPSGFSERLSGKHVAIIPDNDEPGRAHADLVAASLVGHAATIKIVGLPGLREKEDVYDWLCRTGGEVLA